MIKDPFKRLLYLLAIVVVIQFTPRKGVSQFAPGFTQTQIASQLDPTSFVITDDGRVFITEKSGSIRVLQNENLLNEPLIVIPVDNEYERGLQSIVLDPDFGSNQFFYVFYTVQGLQHNRVSRFKASGNYADPATEYILIEFETSGGVHNGGGLTFGADGKLYITTGDGYAGEKAQQLDSTLGKVFRLNKDGSIPEDNPFYNSLTGVYRAIYALGFRNPFRIAKSVDGRIFVNDVGADSYEEVNELHPGKNYGWPLVEGTSQGDQYTLQNYQDPIYAYSHSMGCAIVGGAFYTPGINSFPPEYHGKYFFGDYCSNAIYMLDPASPGSIQTVATNVNRPIAMQSGPDGAFYFISRGGLTEDTQEANASSFDGALWKVIYTGSLVPSIFIQPRDQRIVPGETAIFSVKAAGAEPLFYQWKMNGLTIENETSSLLSINADDLTYSGSTFSCVVSNVEGSVESAYATLTVVEGSRPAAIIVSPASESQFIAGDTLILKASASDAEDGLIPEEEFRWQIDLHHDAHTHPALPLTYGDSIGFIVPLSGETSPNIWYRITLTVKDSDDLTKSVYRDVYPEQVDVTVQTIPPGLQVFLDGQGITAPHTFRGTVNLQRLLNAPPVIYSSDYVHIFKKWNHNVFHNAIQINTPKVDSIFVAEYERIPLSGGNGLRSDLYNQTTSFDAPISETRIDSVINFDWGILPPSAAIGPNNFSIRWSGYIKAPTDGLYTFYLLSDDGSRLWVDGTLVIDNWNAIQGIEKSGAVELKYGNYHHIRLDYFDLEALARVKLSWNSSTLPKSVVPASAFFSLHPNNTPPNIEFSTENNVFNYRINSPFVLKARVTDLQEGTIQASKFVWRIKQFHKDHYHDISVDETAADSITIFVDQDHHLGDDIWYRVFLTVTDSDGATTVDSVDIKPKLVEVTFASNAPEVNISYSGNEHKLPTTFAVIDGSRYELIVPTVVTSGNKFYWLKQIKNEDIYEDGRFVVVFSEGNRNIEIEYVEAEIQMVVNSGVIDQTKFLFAKPISLDAVIGEEAFEDSLIIKKDWSVFLEVGGNFEKIYECNDCKSINFNVQSQNKEIESTCIIVLTAVDQYGNAAIDSLRLTPYLINVEITSNIEHFSLNWNGTIHEGSVINIAEIVGKEVLVEVPDTVSVTDRYAIFESWNNNNFSPVLRFIPMYLGDTTLVANYVKLPPSAKPNVLPIPATSTIELYWNRLEDKLVQYSLLNYQGTKVLSRIVDKAPKSETINLASLSPGIYLLIIQSEEGYFIIKIPKI